MLWQVIEKISVYCFIVAILIVCSKTWLEWENTKRIEIIKLEIKEENKQEFEKLKKEVIRLEVLQNIHTKNTSERMDVIEKQIIKINNKDGK